MMIKSEIEKRFLAVTSYAGAQDFVWMISQSLPPKKKLGSDPNWLVACACMTPEEYMAFGRDGRPWRFLTGKPDVAQRCIDVHRLVLQERCEAMQMECDWSKVTAMATNQQRASGHRDASGLVKKAAAAIRMETPRDDQISDAEAFEQLIEDRARFAREFPEIAP